MKKLAFLVLILWAGIYLYPAGGHWELGGHYSTWSIDVVNKVVEDNFVPDFKYYDPSLGKWNFKSNGNNYGLELRFFPGGKKGSFSIGFSYEKNNFNADMTGTYTATDSHGVQYRADATGRMELKPHSFNVNLRWEIAPSARIHPYIGIGFGVGPQDGMLTAHTKVTYLNVNRPSEEAYETKTLKEAIQDLKDDGNNFPFKFFPIAQVQVGLRAEIVNGVYLMAEGAVYDGLVLRGGLSFRF